MAYFSDANYGKLSLVILGCLTIMVKSKFLNMNFPYSGVFNWWFLDFASPWPQKNAPSTFQRPVPRRLGDPARSCDEAAGRIGPQEVASSITDPSIFYHIKSVISSSSMRLTQERKNMKKQLTLHIIILNPTKPFLMYRKFQVNSHYITLFMDYINYYTSYIL